MQVSSPVTGLSFKSLSNKNSHQSNISVNTVQIQPLNKYGQSICFGLKVDYNAYRLYKSLTSSEQRIEVVKEALKIQDPEIIAEALIDHQNKDKKRRYLGNILKDLCEYDESEKKSLAIKTIVYIAEKLPKNTHKNRDEESIVETLKKLPEDVIFDQDNFKELLKLDSRIFKQCISNEIFLSNRCNLEKELFIKGLVKIIEGTKIPDDNKKLINNLDQAGYSLDNILQDLCEYDKDPKKSIVTKTIVCIAEKLSLKTLTCAEEVTSLVKTLQKFPEDVIFDQDNFKELLKLNSGIFKKCFLNETFLSNKDRLGEELFTKGLVKIVEGTRGANAVKKLINNFEQRGFSEEVVHIKSLYPELEIPENPKISDKLYVNSQEAGVKFS